MTSILLHQDGYVNHVGKKEEIHGLSFVQKYIYIRQNEILMRKILTQHWILGITVPYYAMEGSNLPLQQVIYVYHPPEN
jgi:hypothetical protein